MRLKRGLVLLGFRERLRRRSRRAHRVEREHAEQEEGPARALREGALRGLRALGLERQRALRRLPLPPHPLQLRHGGFLRSSLPSAADGELCAQS